MPILTCNQGFPRISHCACTPLWRQNWVYKMAVKREEYRVHRMWWKYDCVGFTKEAWLPEATQNLLDNHSLYVCEFEALPSMEQPWIIQQSRQYQQCGGYDQSGNLLVPYPTATEWSQSQRSGGVRRQEYRFVYHRSDTRLSAPCSVDNRVVTQEITM